MSGPRLTGIGCPEKKQSFGQRAKQATSTLSFDQYATVHVWGKDWYGRVLGEVELRDGTNLNYELVRQGWCWRYWKYASDEILLAMLEAGAREAKMACGSILSRCRRGSGASVVRLCTSRPSLAMPSGAVPRRAYRLARRISPYRSPNIGAKINSSIRIGMMGFPFFCCLTVSHQDETSMMTS